MLSRPFAPRPLDLRRLDLRARRSSPRRLGDAILELEDVGHRPVEMFRPQVRPGAAIDQLRGDPQPLASSPQAAFKHVADAEFLSYLPNVDGAALVDERRVSGDHRETRETAQCGDDVIDHAIGEVVLLEIAAEIDKGQDRQRRPAGRIGGLADGGQHRSPSITTR